MTFDWFATKSKSKEEEELDISNIFDRVYVDYVNQVVFIYEDVDHQVFKRKISMKAFDELIKPTEKVELKM